MPRLLRLISSLALALPLLMAAVADPLAALASVGDASRAPRPTPRVEVAPPELLSAGDWLSIREAYDAGRHAAFAVDGGHRARNPRQRWATTFDGRGFTTTPQAGDWTWGLDLATYGWQGAEHIVTAPRSVTASGGRVSYAWDERLTEWYVNDRRGLEHGYSVRARPGGARGPLTLDLSVRGGLVPVVSGDGRDVRFVDASGVVVVTYTGLSALDADGGALTARWRSQTTGLRLVVDDQGARYPVTIDPIAQQAYVKASNTGSGDAFGAAIAASADTLVIGAPLEKGGATGVDGDQSDDSADQAGAAYVFVRSGAGWSQQAYLKASNTDASDQFGFRVAVSGDTIVVGALGEAGGATGVDGNQDDDGAAGAGAAYVFVRSGTAWSQQAYLKASNADAGDSFGYSVAASGDTVVVGAYAEDSGATAVNGDEDDDGTDGAGAAYVFTRSGTIWSQEAYLKASNAGPSDFLGVSVAISGDTIVVGAQNESGGATGVDGDGGNDDQPGSGAAYVFVRSGTTWSQQAYLKASNTGAGDRFGVAVSVSGDTLVVGATAEDSSATGVDGDQGDDSATAAGAAYVFARNGTTWSQQAYLKASNTRAVADFGIAVAVSGGRIVVGADLEAGGATGVNGDGSDLSAGFAGAAYLFARSGTTWSQQAYLKASNTDANDRFGVAVALAGNTVVIGAQGESSTATGVDGAQGSDGASGAGATYVFLVPGLEFELQSGRFSDSTKPGKDSFAARAGFAFADGTDDLTFDPATEELRLAVGPAAAPFSLVVPAGDRGWRSSPKKAPTKFTWKSPKGSLPKVVVVLDVKRSRLTVKIKRMEWTAPGTNPVVIDFTMGSDQGVLLEDWRTPVLERP